MAKPKAIVVPQRALQADITPALSSRVRLARAIPLENHLRE